MPNACLVYAFVLPLHRVSNSNAKLSNLRTRSNSKNYLNTKLYGLHDKANKQQLPN